MHSEINLLPKQNNSRLLQGAILACVTTSVVMGWTLVTRPKTNLTATIGSPGNTQEGSPESEIRTETRVPQPASDTPVNSLSQGHANDTIRYYESATGKSFELSLRTGKVEILSDQKLPGFIRTYWSPQGQEVVSAFEQSDGLQYRYFNYTTKQVAPIGKSVTSVAFSPSGRRLAFIDTTEGIASIYIGNTDGTEVRKIFDTRAQEALLEWPQEDMLVLASKRPDRAGKDLSILSLDGGLTVLFSNQENLEHVWSKSGKQLLFSAFIPGQGVQLSYMHMDQKIPVALAVSTSAAKCAWNHNETAVICGIPSTSSLSRDSVTEKTATLDDIAIVSLATGDVEKIYSAKKDALIGISNTLISSSGNYFVFINIFDRRLYVLPIEN